MPQSTAQGVLVRTVSIICSSCEQNASLIERRRLRVALLRAPQACDTSLINAGSIFRSRRIFHAIFLTLQHFQFFFILLFVFRPEPYASHVRPPLSHSMTLQV